MTVTPLPSPEEGTDRAAVAAEVRGWLAKRKIPTYKVGDRLGNSRGYWQRRVSGEIALDIDDLSQLARLVGAQVADFIPRKDPVPPVTEWAPWGSNPRPTD